MSQNIEPKDMHKSLVIKQILLKCIANLTYSMSDFSSIRLMNSAHFFHN